MLIPSRKRISYNIDIKTFKDGEDFTIKKTLENLNNDLGIHF